jgi:DNA-binding response OmpR family regulator
MAYVMVVDDDPDFSGAISTVLKSEGHEVAVESDPQKVPALIQDRRPDAIILDVMFPESDTAGFELARSLRRTFGPLPVLLLTAVNQRFPLGFSTRDLDEDWLPAVEFMEKPIDFKQLSAKVNAVLKLSVGK